MQRRARTLGAHQRSTGAPGVGCETSHTFKIASSVRTLPAVLIARSAWSSYECPQPLATHGHQESALSRFRVSWTKEVSGARSFRASSANRPRKVPL
jgi:hypothetical protein